MDCRYFLSKYIKTITLAKSFLVTFEIVRCAKMTFNAPKIYFLKVCCFRNFGYLFAMEFNSPSIFWFFPNTSYLDSVGYIPSPPTWPTPHICTPLLLQCNAPINLFFFLAFGDLSKKNLQRAIERQVGQPKF